MKFSDKFFASTIAIVAVAGAACQNSAESSVNPGTSASSEETASPAESTESRRSADSVDITDAILTSTGFGCAEYVGQYSSNVSDVQTGLDHVGSLVITTDGETCTFESNQIPSHTIGESDAADFAHEAGEVDATFVISTSPTLNETPTELGFHSNTIMLNGVAWEAHGAKCFGDGPESAWGNEPAQCAADRIDHPWRYDVVSPINKRRLDNRSGHPQADGTYHYHDTFAQLQEQGQECAAENESPVVGFAADGFPVYGPCFTDADGNVRAAQSSFQLKTGERADVEGYTTPFVVGNVGSTTYDGQFFGDYEYQQNSGDLDECNGMIVDGQYGYYTTQTFPYVVRCFSGTPSDDFGNIAGANGRN